MYFLIFDTNISLLNKPLASWIMTSISEKETEKNNIALDQPKPEPVGEGLVSCPISLRPVRTPERMSMGEIFRRVLT